MRPNSKSSIVVLGLVALGIAVPDVAFADKKNPLDGQPAIRHRLELRKRRFEVTPQLAVSMNQDLRHFIGGGLVLNFHINDWLGLALQVAGGGGVDSALGSAVRAKLVPEMGADGEPYGTTMKRPKFQPSREQYDAHLGTINLLTSLYAQVTPMAGKLSIFGALYLRYDLYVMAGFGLMNISNGWAGYNGGKDPSSSCSDPKQNPDPNKCDPLNGGIKAAFMWGLGLHLFFNEWLALNLELRDFVASTNMGGLDVNGDRALNGDDASVSNNLFAGVGLTFMFPLRAKISD